MSTFLGEKRQLDQWEEISDFPVYLVSDRGLVCNRETGRILAQSINQHGIVNVGLMRDGLQHKRSVAMLVAKAFLRQPHPRFNTPIHLNGARHHTFVENLMWRPRAFAIAYHKQMEHEYSNRIDEPVVDLDTGERFENSFDAATTHGLLERAVVMSVLNEDVQVFPTGQKFGLSKNRYQ